MAVRPGLGAPRHLRTLPLDSLCSTLMRCSDPTVCGGPQYVLAVSNYKLFE